MPPGPEAVVERTICKEAKDDGWLVRKVTFLGTRGAPDRLFGKGKRAVLIEFKAENDGVLSLQQIKRHKELREVFGLEVHVCDSIRLGRYILNLPTEGA